MERLFVRSWLDVPDQERAYASDLLTYLKVVESLV